MTRAAPRPPSAPRGKRAPQQARSRRTRERILAAAVGCFERDGYEATTTAAIAAAAGVAVGTLYGYFEDKRAILLELLERTVGEIADPVVRGLDPDLWRGGEPRERVRGLIDAVFHTRTVSPGLQRILWQRYFTDPGFRDAVLAIEGRIRGALEALIETLRAEGRLRADDPHTAAFVVYMAVEWTATRLTLGESDVDTEATVEAASDMISRFLFR